MAQRAKKKRKAGMIVLVVFMMLLAVLLIGGGFWMQYYFGGLNTTQLTKDHKSLGISPDAKQDDQIVNIALFGVDSRTTAILGRADAMMILSVDKRHGKLKLTSILRDSAVYIEDHGWDKVTHAFAYGKAPLTIKTLNQNFNMNIQEYVAVNFYSLAHVIDKLGGMDLEISNAEKNEINRLIQKKSSGYAGLGLDMTLVKQDGLVHLNGVQAMTYARIRKIDSDTERSSRQQIVIDKLFKMAKKMKKSAYPSLIREILPMIETSLDYSDIIGLSTILTEPDLSLEKLTLPDNSIPGMNLMSTIDENGRWVWKYDLEVAGKALNKFIYEE